MISSISCTHFSSMDSSSRKEPYPRWWKRALLYLHYPKKSWRQVHEWLWTWRGREGIEVLKSNHEKLEEALFLALTQGKAWPRRLRKEFALHFPSLNLISLQTLLGKAISQAVEKKQKVHPEVLLKLFSSERLRTLLRETDPDAPPVHELARELDSILRASRFPPKRPLNAWKRWRQAMKEQLSALLNTLLRTLDFYESSQSAHTVWEKAALFDLYFKLFILPLAIVNFLTPLGLITWKIYLITTLLLLGGAVGLFIYQKWLRPCPTRLHGCVNLTEKARNGELSPIINQQGTIQRILDYCRSPRTGKQHILLVGRTGVGKTTAVEGAAERLVSEAASRMPHHQIFQINTADLMRRNPMRDEGYGNLLDQIRKSIRGKEERIILFFDEFPKLLGEEGKKFAHSLNSHLNPGGVKCLAAVTEEDYEKMRKDESLKALLNRFTKLEVHELDEAGIEALLEMTWQQEAPDIPIDKSLWQELKRKIGTQRSDGVTEWAIREAKTLIHELAASYRRQWEEPLENPQSKKIRAKRDKLLQRIQREQNASPSWFYTEEGKKRRERLGQLGQEIASLDSVQAKRMAQASHIQRLRHLFNRWNKEEGELRRAVACGGREKAKEEEFLLYHLLLRPALATRMESERQQLSDSPPQKVDADFFHRFVGKS